MRAFVFEPGIPTDERVDFVSRALRFCDVIDGLRAAQVVVHCSTELWNNPNVLRLAAHSKDPDTQYASVRFKRSVTRCADVVHGEVNEAIRVNNLQLASCASLQAACNASREDGATVCVDFGDRDFSDGVHQVVDTLGAADVWYCSTPESVSPFFRWAIARIVRTDEQFIELAPFAFPRLDFHPTLTFRRFSQSMPKILANVLRHLEALNDSFLDLLKLHKGVAKPALDAMRALHGVDASIESDKTRHDTAKMAERIVQYNGCSYRCELHTKLGPELDRIHFYPELPSEAGNRILIGIFVDHLSI